MANSHALPACHTDLREQHDTHGLELDMDSLLFELLSSYAPSYVSLREAIQYLILCCEVMKNTFDVLT